MSRFLLLCMLGVAIVAAKDSALSIAAESLSITLESTIQAILKVALHPIETVNCAGDQTMQLLNSLASLSGTLIGSYVKIIFKGLDSLPDVAQTLRKSLNNFQGNPVSKVCTGVSAQGALDTAQEQIGKLTSVVNEIANLLG
ncbi:hypothetical protein PRIPAC_86614 [Pristionchus pacificus]|uniref:Uncharacterized protein n=1 Tax=Pristionchus pacificus TaxID=54126 RepID=A0A2A6BTH4_PRIPA|nr:hypothetical protein PRIPAC_86614 [Pristionchus pacificus]|eukprot:PDM69194.1 hypothetical protein PRIPAC_47496 [Pristionchus pacificus]